MNLGCAAGQLPSRLRQRAEPTGHFGALSGQTVPSQYGVQRAHGSRSSCCARKQLTVLAQKGDPADRISGLARSGDRLADSAASSLSLPPFVVKGAAVLFGGLFLWGLVKQVLSLALFAGVVAGSLFVYSKVSAQSQEPSQSADPGSPLDEARKIWDKYK